MFALGFIAGGSVIALGLGWLAVRLTRSGFAWRYLAMGVGAFVATEVIQPVLVLPVALLIHGPRGLRSLVPSSVPEAIYYGVVAGVVQEGLKLGAMLTPIRRRSWAAASIAVGTGFGLTEVVLLGASTLAQSHSAGVGALGLPLLERSGALLLHIGAAGIIGWGLGARRWRIGVASAVGAHAVPDSAVELLALFHLRHGPTLGFELGNLLWGGLTYAAAILLLRRLPASEC